MSAYDDGYAVALRDVEQAVKALPAGEHVALFRDYVLSAIESLRD